MGTSLFVLEKQLGRGMCAKTDLEESSDFSEKGRWTQG